MRYPVNYIGISKGYHQGKCLDFGWSALHGGKNQPIFAVADGTVYSVEKQAKGGNVIYIVHKDNKCSCYAHVGKVLVKKGDKVFLGQQIATMDKTGETTGEHLHFGLFASINTRYNNSTLNPFDYLEVYPDQIVGSTTSKKYPIKYHKETKEYFVSAQSLNVRSKASLLSKTVNTLPKGTKVNYIEKVGSFIKIGDNQYVWGSYITDKYSGLVRKTKQTTAELNVRKTPNGSLCKSNCPLPKGTIVAIMESKNGWTKIDENRWVSSNYLK